MDCNLRNNIPMPFLSCFQHMRRYFLTENYQIDKKDFVLYLNNANSEVLKKNQLIVENLNHSYNYWIESQSVGESRLVRLR
jgi:predicted acetyltransferase